MDSIDEQRDRCVLFLLRLYDVTEADEHQIVRMWDLGQELGFTRDATGRIVQCLESENLITVIATSGAISITHSGIVRVSPMVEKSEREYLEGLRAHAADTVRYFSNELKPERERAVCRALLRCVGVSFAEKEIVAPSEEPADVSFREAQFQVRELVEEGRRRGDEWKLRQERWNRVQSAADVSEPSTSPVPMQFSGLVSALTQALKDKSEKYGKRQCAGIDALVYVNLTTLLDRNSPLGDVSNLESQGWRSVCVLFPPYGLVLFAREEAPHFLRQLAGKTLCEWSSLDGLFDP